MEDPDLHDIDDLAGVARLALEDTVRHGANGWDPVAMMCRDTQPVAVVTCESNKAPGAFSIGTAAFDANLVTVTVDTWYGSKDFPKDHPALQGPNRMTMGELRDSGVPGIGDMMLVAQYSNDSITEYRFLPYIIQPDLSVTWLSSADVDGFEVQEGSFMKAIELSVKAGFTMSSPLDDMGLQREVEQLPEDKRRFAMDAILASLISEEYLRGEGTCALYQEKSMAMDPVFMEFLEGIGFGMRTMEDQLKQDGIDIDQLKWRNN